MAAKESKNTLRSRSTARVLDLLGEGQIEVIGGDKGVYLSKTVLEENNGKRNFDGVRVTFKAGTVNQSYMRGFRNVENEVNMGVELKKPSPVIRTIVDTDADAVIMKVGVSALTNVPNKKKGDIKPTRVDIGLYRKNNGGAYVKVASVKISGKTNSAYNRSIRVDLPAGTGPWDIKWERETNDSDTQFKRNDTFVPGYTLVYETKLTYPYCALAGLEVDAKRFGSSFPDRIYEARRINAPYPSNWNPNTRVYTGIWDGTFLTGTHDNPAWYLWEIQLNNRFGLGDIITASGVNKWTLYTIAQYCDGMVPDGKGGTEPRFTFNGSVTDRREAIKLLDAIASVFRGMIYWAAGYVDFSQDRPGTPSKMITPANTIDGIFNRPGSARKARHTHAIVAWNNPALLGEVDYVTVQRDRLINKFGYRPKEVAAFGCTSEGQARRMGDWLLDTEEVQDGVVTWSASFDQIDAYPGEHAQLFDPTAMGARWSGRVIEVIDNYEVAAKDLTNAIWTKSNVVIVSNALADYEGNVLADKVNETVVTNTHFWYQQHTGIAIGTRVSRLVIAKQAERTRIRVELADFTAFQVGAVFDLAAGTVAVQPIANAGFSNPVASIQALGNGYYACKISATKANSDPDVMSTTYLITGTSTSNYLGVSGSGVYIAHSQWEIADVPHVPVEFSAVLLDGPVWPTTGETYDLNLILQDGTVYTEDIVKFEDDAYNVNLIRQPFNIADAEWVKTALGITNNYAIAPDGTQTADRMIPTAAATAHYMDDLLLYAQSSEISTASVYAKASGYSRIGLQILDVVTTNYYFAHFDLTTGTVINTSPGGSGVTIGATIEKSNLEDYWILTVTGRANTAGGDSCRLRVLNLSPAGATSWTADGVSGILAWGFKLEAGSVRTPVNNGRKLISLEARLPSLPVPYGIWTMNGTDVVGEYIMITGIFERKPNLFEVQAVIDDPTKYARVERNVIVDHPSYTLIASGKLAPPTEIDISEYFLDNVDPGLLVSWLPSSDARTLSYEFQLAFGDDDLSDPVTIDSASVELDQIDEGPFTFQIRSVSNIHPSSDWVVKKVSVMGANAKPSDVEDLRVNSDGSIATLKWTKNQDTITDSYEIRFSPLLTGADWNGAVMVGQNISKRTDNFATVSRVGTFLIKAVSRNGKLSVNAAKIVCRIGVIESTYTGDVNESADWFGLSDQSLGIMGNSTTGYYTDTSRWTLLNMVLGPPLNERETAVNGVHSLTSKLHDIEAIDHVTYVMSYIPQGGRNTRHRIEDQDGNFVTADFNGTTFTVVSSSATGFTGLSAVASNLGGGVAKLELQFDALETSQTLKVTVTMLNGASSSYLGVVTAGFNQTQHTIYVRNKQMIENGGGALELAPAADYRMTGYYLFANSAGVEISDPSVDLGKQTAVKFRASFEYTVTDDGGVLGDLAAIGDAGAIGGNSDGVTITPQLRSANYAPGPITEPPPYGEWMDLTDALFIGRGFQFRFLVVSDNPLITPVITDANINWEVPVYVESGSGLVYGGAGWYTVTYGQEFLELPAIQITPYTQAEIEFQNRTVTGFQVRFKSISSGTLVSRTFDWTANGNGPVI